MYNRLRKCGAPTARAEIISHSASYPSAARSPAMRSIAFFFEHCVDAFHDNVAPSKLANDPGIFHPKSGVLAVTTAATTVARKVLTGEAAANCRHRDPVGDEASA